VPLVTDALREGEIARIAELLHDLDGTQHYITHEQDYDGDDIEGVACATGIDGHTEDAADLYAAGLRLIEGSDPASPEAEDESVPPVLAAWFNDRASAIRDVAAHRASPPEYPGMALVPVTDLDRLARYAELPKAAFIEGADPAIPENK
jgi:hypothetical protein